MGNKPSISKVAWRVLVTVAFVTGVTGWVLQGSSFVNAVYQTLQMFLLEFPEDLTVNPILQIGRFAAAFATGATLLALGWQVVDGRLNRRRMSGLRGHTIVIGCGGTGAAILDNLCREEARKRPLSEPWWRRVATRLRLDLPSVRPKHDLLALDIAPEALERIAQLDVHTLQGDGRNPTLLQQAQAGRAGRIIIAVEDWGPATEIAKVMATISTSAQVLTHVDSLTLLHALRARVLTDPDEPGEVFNLHENAARALLQSYDDRLAGGDAGARRIVVLGGNQITEALVVHATYAWLASLREFPLQIRIVGEQSEAILGDIRGRWPELADRLSESSTLQSSAMDYAAHADIRSDDLIVIDLEDDDHAVAVGTRIRARHRDVDLTVLSRRPPDEELVPLTVCELSSLAWTENILNADSLWQLAYSLHETYRQGVLADTSPNGVPWEELSLSIRHDNHAAIVHMLQQLRQLGWGLQLASSRHVARSVEELSTIIPAAARDALAESEHERWIAAKRRTGEARRHYQEWGQLDETARDWVRTTVATWPRLLLRLGYELDVPDVDPVAASLLEDATLYHRTGAEVRAERVAEPTEWQTANGDRLAAAPGDWMLEAAGRGCWSISETALLRTYEHLGGDRYRAVGRVEAVRLTGSTTVHSPEGAVSGQEGDWLLRNEPGDVWIVDASSFHRHYEPAAHRAGAQHSRAP